MAGSDVTTGTDLRPAPSASDHVRGSLGAPVVIVEFGDFECPYCGEAFTALESVLRTFEGRVALVFRHFPLAMHPHAMAAAQAAEAAAHAGKFWEMHDLLFRHQDALELADLRQYAKTIGISEQDVAKAVEHNTYRERIERDRESGNQSEIEGTPALFINGFAYDGPASVEALSEVIELALKSA